MIINGSSYSRFIITSTADIPSEIIIELPLTNEAGLVESYTTRQIRHELIGLDIDTPTIQQAQRILGYQISWTFNYGGFITGETLMKIQDIIRYAKLGYGIKIVPRVDQDSRFFTVIYSGDNFDIGVKRGGSNAKYNRLPVFRFETKNLETDLKWSLIVPVDQSYYVTGDDGFSEVLAA